MTSEQRLEALRVQLTSLADDLQQLVILKPTAPSPSPSSPKYDAYVTKLGAIEKKLAAMEKAFTQLKGQGKAYQGKQEEEFRAKQREKSFQDLVKKVDAAMGLCLDLLMKLNAPDKSKTVKGAVDLAKKLDEFMKMVHAPQAKATVGHGDPVIVAPSASPSPEVLVLPFVVAAIVLIRGLQKAVGK